MQNSSQNRLPTLSVHNVQAQFMHMNGTFSAQRDKYPNIKYYFIFQLNIFYQNLVVF